MLRVEDLPVSTEVLANLQRMVTAAPTGTPSALIAAVRRWVGRAGILGIGCVAANLLMLKWSLSRGIHCLACDYFQIHAGIPWWEAFYGLKHDLVMIGGGLGLAATLVGKPRWFGLVALAGAIYVTGFIYYK